MSRVNMNSCIHMGVNYIICMPPAQARVVNALTLSTCNSFHGH